MRCKHWGNWGETKTFKSLARCEGAALQSLQWPYDEQRPAVRKQMGNFALTDYLIEPVQRIGRYSLFLSVSNDATL